MEKILVLDCGGQDAQPVARRVRALGVYSEVLPGVTARETVAAGGYRGVILSGAQEAPDIAALGLPVLPAPADGLDGEAALKRFLLENCGCRGDWSAQSFIEASARELKEKIGARRVLCALSGGVDSSVLAALLHRAVGDQLTCMFVDHGLMRKGEPEQVAATFRGQFGVHLVSIDARSRFLERLSGVTDPEKKRKIIGEEFIRVFEDESKKLGKIECLGQGTIYPDILESGTIGGKALVKSHHNVGGMPAHWDFEELIEPLSGLFKDEVRAVGKALGLPDAMTQRQPFPGPGLGVRIIGEITREKLDILREADAIFREEVENAPFDPKPSQYFAVLTNIRSVGVRDDARTYEYTVGLRAVNTVDFMTADWAELPLSLLRLVSRRITEEVKGISRVVYDVTTKPPATVEWE